MASRAAPVSPRQIDPLSWITGPVVPVMFAILSIVLAVRDTLVDGAGATPWLQASALVLSVASLLFLYLVGRRVRRTVGARAAAASCALAVVAMILSSLGHAGRPFAVEQWWAPISLGLVFGALGPYLAASRILVICGLSTLVAVPVSVALIAPASRVWGPVSVVAIVAIAPLAGVFLSAVMSAHVVRRMRALLEEHAQTVVAPRAPLDEETERNERARLVELTARAVPFLESIVAAGTISSPDRALAGQLARRLRDDLVTQAGESWLDRIDEGSRLVVVDPEHRADALRPSQRTALRGLIHTLLAPDGLAALSVLVELRAGDVGETAVGISMDADLPEGRRVVYLAPAILTLETAAERIDLIADEVLRLDFRFPHDERPPDGGLRL